MKTISPNYYAASVLNEGFTLIGGGFELIPDNTIGLLASNNDEPLLYRSDAITSAALRYKIVEKTPNKIVLQAELPVDYHNANYLGALMSPDGNTLYWVNNSKPLP